MSGQSEELLDEVTRHLCRLCQRCEDKGMENLILEAEVRAWWDDHKAADRARREEEAENTNREQLRRNALGKLTSEERVALGHKQP